MTFRSRLLVPRVSSATATTFSARGIGQAQGFGAMTFSITGTVLSVEPNGCEVQQHDLPVDYVGYRLPDHEPQYVG
jgi:hypothetical protein